MSLLHFSFIDKAKDRLSSWEFVNLSNTSRVTLAKSIIQAMPIYVVQAANIPKCVYEEIDKHCRSFIWGDEVGARKTHLLNGKLFAS